VRRAFLTDGALARQTRKHRSAVLHQEHPMTRFLFRRLAVALALSTLASASPAARLPTLLAGDTAWAGRTANVLQLTASEQKLRDDPIRFRNTVVGGMVTQGVQSCVGGAIDILMRGGPRTSIKRGCLNAAKTGIAAGAEDGYIVAVTEEANRRNIAATQLAASQVQQDNQRLQAFLDSSAQVLRDGQQRLATLKSDVANRRLSAAEAEQARQREEQNLQAMQNSLAEAKKTRVEYQKAASQFSTQRQNARDLDAQLKQMDAQIGALETNIDQYQKALRVSRA